MLKLNVGQLRQAVSLAHEINTLEGAKDRAADVVVHVEDFGLRFAVPPELVRAEISKRLAFAHEALAAFGIELEPGGEMRQAPLPQQPGDRNDFQRLSDYHHHVSPLMRGKSEG